MRLFTRYVNYYKNIFTICFSWSIKTSGQNTNSDDKKINESISSENKNLFKIDDIDVNKMQNISFQNRALW